MSGMRPNPLLLVILCAGLLSLGAAPAPAPSLPAALPTGAEPLPAALERRVDELVRQTESIRGLRLVRPVLRGVLYTGAEPLYLTARIDDGRVESEVSRDRPWPADEKVVAEELGPFLRSLG